MKVKLNLDKGTIRAFFLHHTEKIVFGGVALCFVFMVYVALSRASFDRTPDELGDAAQNAEKHWKTTTGSTLEVTKYDEMVSWWRDHPIKAAPYEFPTPWDSRIFAPLGPRRQPAVFAVEDLHSGAGVGAFEMKPTAGKSATKGQRWVVLTGLVPAGRQQAAFDACFKDAEKAEKEDPMLDKVKYAGYTVERAEVTGSDVSAPLVWSKKFNCSGEKWKSVVEEWSKVDVEVVDEKFVDGNLTFPLGPLADRPWGPAIAHPEIPMKNMPAGDPSASSAAPAEATPADGVADDPFGAGRGPAKVAPVKTAPAPGGGKAEGSRLFRFFDFTVEPGKKYVYHVTLAVQNPNFGMEARYLEDKDLALPKYLTNKPAEATQSGVISVPRDNRLFAVSVTPPTRPADAPYGKILVQQFVMETGKMSSKEFDVVRGKVLNFYGEPPPAVKPPKGRAEAAEDGIVAKKDAPPSSVDYETDALALDMRGGELLPGRARLSIPGEMLILDPDGSLVVHNELDDKAASEESPAPKSGASGNAATPDASAPAGGKDGGFGKMY